MKTLARGKRMRKIYFIVLCIVWFNLLSCSTTNSISSTQAITTTTTTTTTVEIPYFPMEVGQLDELMKSFSKFNQKFQQTPQIEIKSNLKTTTWNQSYGISRELHHRLNLDLIDFYLYQESYTATSPWESASIEYLFEKDDQIHKYTATRTNPINHTIVMDIKTEPGMRDLLAQYGFSTNSDMEYLNEVVKKSSTNFTAKVGFPYWSKIIGESNVAFLRNLTDVVLNEQVMDVSIWFEADYSSYLITFKCDLTGKYQQQFYRLELELTTSNQVKKFKKQTVSEMGFQIEAARNPENVEHDGNLPVTFVKLSNNQDNWIRYTLHPSHYRLSYHEGAIRIYDESLQEIPLKDSVFQVEEAGVYYLNIIPSYRENYIQMTDLGYTDTVDELVFGTQNGVIQGNMESPIDINRYTFVKGISYQLITISLDQENTTIPQSNFYLQNGYKECNVGRNTCYYFLTPDESVDIQIKSTEPGLFSLNYTYTDVSRTSQTFKNLQEASSYNIDRPIWIGWGTDYAIFTITLENETRFNIEWKYLVVQSHLLFEVYNLDGEKMTGLNPYHYILPAGTYILKFIQGSAVFYPIIRHYPNE